MTEVTFITLLYFGALGLISVVILTIAHPNKDKVFALLPIAIGTIAYVFLRAIVLSDLK